MHTDDICYYILAITMKEAGLLSAMASQAWWYMGFLTQVRCPWANTCTLRVSMTSAIQTQQKPITTRKMSKRWVVRWADNNSHHEHMEANIHVIHLGILSARQQFFRPNGGMITVKRKCAWIPILLYQGWEQHKEVCPFLSQHEWIQYNPPWSCKLPCDH